jgi:hypothetical protein
MVAPITPQNVQSPQSVTRKRRLAEAMMQQGTDTSPVGHPLGALARAMQGGMAGYMSHKADTAEKEGQADFSSKLQQAMANQEGADWSGLAGHAYAPEGLQGVLYSKMFPEAPKPTDDMREFDFSQTNPAFAEYMQRRSPQTNVTVEGGKYGTIPPGFQLVEGPEGARMEPIPGGPAALEQAAAEEKKRLSQGQAGTTADVVTEDVGRAIQAIQNDPSMTTGIVGQVLGSIGGTQAHDVNALITTIGANIGFDKLQQMRQNSPTGGALGPVSDFENKLLQATFGALQQSQTDEQLVYSLKRVNDLYNQIVHGPNAQQGQQQQQAPGQKRLRYNPATGELE